MTRTAPALGIGSAVLAVHLAAVAAPKSAAPAAPPTPPSAALLHELRSSDEAQIRAGLDEVRRAGRAAAGVSREVTALLDRGLTVELTVAALDTLAEIEVESTTERIVPYLAHRNAHVRKAAARALGKTRGVAAVKPLRRALADRDADVRSLAAAALGAMKAREAVADLFLALERGIGAAAPAIGRLCAGDECDRLIGTIGRRPLDVVIPGLDEVLFRADTGVGDDAKVKLIQRVREIATADANRFLRDAQRRWPKEASPRVKQAIDQAVLATGGSGAP